MSRKARDMTGTVRCSACPAEAEHERGPGSPLVIRHHQGCPEFARVRRPDVRLLDYFDGEGDPLWDGAMADFVASCHAMHVEIQPNRDRPQPPIEFAGTNLPALPRTDHERAWTLDHGEQV